MAVIAGGGMAAAFHTVTGMARAASSVETAGAGNFVLSTAEAAGAGTLSLLAIALPAIGIGAVVFILFLAYRPGRAALRRIRS